MGREGGDMGEGREEREEGGAEGGGQGCHQELAVGRRHCGEVKWPVLL